MKIIKIPMLLFFIGLSAMVSAQTIANEAT